MAAQAPSRPEGWLRGWSATSTAHCAASCAGWPQPRAGPCRCHRPRRRLGDRAPSGSSIPATHPGIPAASADRVRGVGTGVLGLPRGGPHVRRCGQLEPRDPLRRRAGGPLSALQVVFAHIGRPSLRAINAVPPAVWRMGPAGPHLPAPAAQPVRHRGLVIARPGTSNLRSRADGCGPAQDRPGAPAPSCIWRGSVRLGVW